MSTKNKLMLDVGQAEELKLAFRRNDWNNSHIKTLSEGDFLAEVLKVIKGQSEIKPIEHLIDTDAAPFRRPDWFVEKHIGRGLWRWNPDSIELFLSKKQKEKYQIGHELREIIESLTGKMVLNANVLDYLLDHSGLIPESWKGKEIFFWGTIYRDHHSKLYVRCLRWYDSEWRWHYYWLLNGGFNSDCPAALVS